MTSGLWRRLGPSHVTATEALARGRELLDTSAPGDPVTLAWWLVDRNALVLGRGARVQANAARCRDAGVEVLRRASGGGPVLWGPDLLAVDVMVPRDHPLHTDDVVASYRWLGEVFVAVLTSLGIDARALPPAEARATNDRRLAELACFAGRSPWEVVRGSGKVVGLSQARRRTGTLMQAGVALHVDGLLLADLLDLDAVDRIRVRDAFDHQWPPDLIDPAELIPAVDAAVAHLLTGVLPP